MTSGSELSSAARKDPSLSTRVAEKSRLARLSSRTIRSASMALSSRLRMRMCWVSTKNLRRGFVHGQPVKTEVGDRFHEGVEFDWLHDIAVHAELIALHAVSLLRRGGDDDAGNLLRALVRFHGAQHIDAVDLRQLQIEKDDARTTQWIPARVLAAPEDEIERLGVVAYSRDAVGQIPLLQCSHRELEVVRVVFDEKDLHFV